MRFQPVLAVTFLSVTPVLAQPQAPPRVLTADDYARAERFLDYNTSPLVFGASVRPTWLDDDRFWYRNAIPEGHEFVLVDPGRRTRTRAFDHARLAEALSSAAGTQYEPFRLPFQQFRFAADAQAIVFDLGPRRFTCDVEGNACAATERKPDAVPPNSVVSPDGGRAAFVRNHNLWVRDFSSGRDTQLTTDGVPDFAYATNNAGWTKSDRPVLLWSPDSKHLATFQHDGRGVADMYLVETKVGHPTLEQWKYPLPGDKNIFMIHRVVIDLDPPRVVRLDMPPDAHRSSLCDHVVCGGEWVDVEWSPDAAALVFLSTSRDHKRVLLRAADARTGAVREVLNETSPTFFESGAGRVNWHALPASNELIWYSQRGDWGHLYLYDLATGQLKHQITRDNWNVSQVLRVDEGSRTIFFTAVGREPGDPYFRRFYRVQFDGTGLTLLTPEDADHTVTLAPSGRYWIDSYSTPVRPPATVVRDPAGRIVLTVEHADISRLMAAGWQPPIPITVKARDGQTELYGLLFRPSWFDETKKYPIVNRVYPGPQSGSVGSRSFSAARADSQALAELGFIVVSIDAMGTPNRSKTFHAAYYRNMGDNGLPDQVAGMQELARRYPWIDVDRAGIYGHSGGGFASAGAILRYPDFFKVAVSQAGNHDNREYEDDWGEKWQGLLETGPEGATNYDDQANQTHAKNLKGKLLIAHGTLDSNVPPYNTLLVVNELIKHNKDFDLILFPNRRHGFGSEAYMTRRRWDYFVRHLLGAEPPKEYEMKPPADAATVRPPG